MDTRYAVALLAAVLLGGWLFVEGGLPLAGAVVLFAAAAAVALNGARAEDDAVAAAAERELLGPLDAAPEVERTEARSGGRAVYETRVDGRPVTAAVVHTGTGRAVEVATPLRVARAGVGFAVHGPATVTVDREPTGVEHPDALLDGARATLADTVDEVGRLRVDDRLGVVEHRLDRLDDGDQFRRQARAVVDVARAVERAAEPEPESDTTDAGRTVARPGRDADDRGNGSDRERDPDLERE